ncbi:MAG: SCO family protein [Acidimicrobiia bacterium]|nr:SCO family protein [Acidimicrobiia bacterium]
MGRTWVATAVALLIVAACGSDDQRADRELSGATKEPLPVVDESELPDALADDEPTSLRPPEGGLLLVYFGYTHCPDICPTTLLTLERALERLPEDDRDRVAVAMVSVDPERDSSEIFANHVEHFLADAPLRHAFRTDDQVLLDRVADSFGVTAVKEPYGDGPDEYEIGHSAQVFAVDDQGRIVVEWTFGTESGPIADDILTLLARIDGGADTEQAGPNRPSQRRVSSQI